MKPESYAWQRLREHAAAQLRRGFADRVLRVTHGSPAETEAWNKLHAAAAAQLHPSFAQRVLQAARAITEPSFFSQFAVSAATAAVCLLAVVFIHQRATQTENAANIASWQQIASAAAEYDLSP
jgi:hypothetical protein